MENDGSHIVGDENHQRRCAPRLDLSTSHVASNSSKSTGFTKSSASLGSLHSSWGSEGNQMVPKSKVFDTLVYHQQGGQLWPKETSSHQRLQVAECTFGAPEVLPRKHTNCVSSTQKRDVCSQNRPQKCLLPSGIGRKVKSIPLYASRPKVLPMA